MAEKPKQRHIFATGGGRNGRAHQLGRAKMPPSTASIVALELININAPIRSM
jgi:hypothetical protein